MDKGKEIKEKGLRKTKLRKRIKENGLMKRD